MGIEGSKHKEQLIQALTLRLTNLSVSASLNLFPMCLTRFILVPALSRQDPCPTLLHCQKVKH